MKNNFKIFFGSFLIFIGIFTNRIILEKFVSPYAIVELNYRIPIILINLFFVVCGILVILLKKGHFTPEKIFNLYKVIGLNFFTVFLLFVSLNIIVYIFLVFRDIGFYKDQIFFSYSQPLKGIYPDFKGRDVNLLLYETWSRPYVYSPYVQFKERVFDGKFIKVHPAGFRITKEQGPWPPDPNNLNIFMFGGSTTFGYGVKNEQTISSYLQNLLALNHKASILKVCLYNFGAGNYFSSQEKILFQDFLSKGYVPDIAVFLDGLNDFYHIDDEPVLTERLRKFVDNKGKTFIVDLPLVNVIRDVKKIGDVSSGKVSSEEKYNDPEKLNRVIGRYIANKKQIEAIANIYKIKTLFIWQPVPTYKYDLKYHIFSGMGFGRFIYSKYGYEQMRKFISKNNLGSDFLWLADIQEGVKKPLYVDIDHYTAEFSQEIASNIYNFLIKAGWV